MKQNKTTAFKISSMSVALMTVYGAPAFAADDEVMDLITPKSSVSAGVSFQNNDRKQLGIFDGRQENNGKILLDADIKKRDDATGIWNTLRIRDFGLDSRELDVSHSRQGDYGVSFEYTRIPREFAYTVNTGLRGVGTTNQTLTVVAPGAGSNVELGMHRDRYTLKLNKFFSGSLELTMNYRQEAKKGLRNFGTYSGAQAAFAVEPINSTTRQFDLNLNYVGKDLQLQGGYYGSWYDNANSLLTLNVPAAVYVALPPDNKAHQLYLNGAYAITPATRATMRLARTTATQNDQSLLTALPAAQVWAGYGGVTAKVVTTEAQLGISSRITDKLSLLANVQYNDRKDKTPHVAFNSTPVPPDETTPHSFTTWNAKLEASYRVDAGFRLLGGVYLDIKERSLPFNNLNTPPAAPTNAGGNWTVNTVSATEREVPYRAKNKELTFKGQATKNLLDELNGSLALAHSKRDGSNFKWTDQMNLINPLHMANRDRDKVGLKMDWSPSEIVSVQAQIDHAKDDYGRNGLWGDYTAPNGNTLLGTGIRDGSAKLFSLDASFKLSDSWQLTAWYSRDESKATQYAYQANNGTNPQRRADLADIGDSIGIGVKGKASANLMIGADLLWNKSVGQYRQSNILNAANIDENLPDITNKTLRLALNGIYQLDKNSSVRLDLIHDRWDTNDWTWTMWNNAQTALVPFAYGTIDGTSVSGIRKQSANSVAVRYKYEF